MEAGHRLPLIEAYGLTETSPAATINPLDLPAYNGSIGLPIPSTEVVLRDDDGKDVPLGPARRDLHPRPAGDGGLLATARTRRRRCIDDDGWFATGDIGVMDERGFVKIVDRKKDMILVSGFNVYPNEIEARRRDASGRARMRGGRRARREVGRGGEALRREEGPSADRGGRAAALPRAPDRLQDARATSSSATELPKSNVGKILRRELRDEAKRKAAA